MTSWSRHHHMRLEFDDAIATSILPTGGFGMPAETSTFFQVAPPTRRGGPPVFADSADRTRRRHGLGLTLAPARRGIDADAPQVHAAAPLAREVQPTAVGRPHGIPVHRRIMGDRHRRAARRGNHPDVCLLYTSDAADE